MSRTPNGLAPFGNAATGVVTTVAGNGATGSSGDGGAAIAAPLGYPHRVAVDAAGDLYISDPYDSRIRKVTMATGIISTVAGIGTPGFTGDGGPATAAAIAIAAGAAVWWLLARD